MDISGRNLNFYNQRKEERYKLRCVCSIEIDGIYYDAEISDISFGGVAIIVKSYRDEVDIDDKLTFKFYRTNYPVAEMESLVRNINHVGDYTRLGMQIIGGNKEIWDLIVKQVKNGL